jgi:DNA-binding transcriptional regulator YdaS (Cro superfamily)
MLQLLPAAGPVKVRQLTKVLGGQSQVASALRVDRAQVTRWLRGARPAPANEAQIDALEFVLARLGQRLAPDTAVKWLTGINAHLGNRRPLDLLADDRVAEVVAAIEQEHTESYA